MAGAIVQSKSINLIGTGPVLTTVTLDSPTQAGSTLVACFSAYDTGNSPGWPYIEDANATWVPGADQWSWTTFNGVTQIQYAPNIPARNPYTLKVDVPNCEYFQVFIMEVTGLKTTPVEVNNFVQSQAAGTTARSGATTPAAASFLVAAITEDTGTTVNSVTAGWTERYDGNTGQPLHVATRAGATGSNECVFTAAASMSSAAGIILGLQEAVGAPTTHFGVVARPSTFGAVVQGRRKTFGVVARPAAFAAAVAGQRKTFGVVALPITNTRAVAGVRKVLGQVALPLTCTRAVAGVRQAVGQAALSLSVLSSVVGRRKTFSTTTSPYTFSSRIVGTKDSDGLVLNDADKIYLGNAASAVYAGADKVWP